MDTFCCNSGSSRVRVRSDPIEWRQPIVEPSLISWTVKREFGCLNNTISLQQCKIHHQSSVEMQISFSTYLSEVLCAQTQHALHWCQWPAQCNIYWWLVHEHWLFGRTTLQGVVGAASDMKILLEYRWYVTICSPSLPSSIFFISRSFLLLDSEWMTALPTAYQVLQVQIRQLHMGI